MTVSKNKRIKLAPRVGSKCKGATLQRDSGVMIVRVSRRVVLRLGLAWCEFLAEQRRTH